MGCSPPGSAVPGILQARVLEWGAIAFSAASLRIFSKAYLLCIFGVYFKRLEGLKHFPANNAHLQFTFFNSFC